MKIKKVFILSTVALLLVGCGNDGGHGSTITLDEAKTKLAAIQETAENEELPSGFNGTSTAETVYSDNSSELEKQNISLADYYIYNYYNTIVSADNESETTLSESWAWVDGSKVYTAQDDGNNKIYTVTDYTTEETAKNTFDLTFGAISEHIEQQLSIMSFALFAYMENFISIAEDTSSFFEGLSADETKSSVSLESKSKGDGHLYMNSKVKIVMNDPDSTSTYTSTTTSELEVEGYKPKLYKVSDKADKTFDPNVDDYTVYEKSYEVLSKFSYQVKKTYPDLTKFSLVSDM